MRPVWLTRNVAVLGAVSFFTDLSSEMLYPLVPLFLTGRLGAPVWIVGLIEGVAEATASLLKVASGWLSDRTGSRQPLVFAGYGLSAFSRPLLAYAAGWPAVLAARFLDRFGKGVRGAPRDALLAESVVPTHRAKAFGLHRSMDQSGAVAGPLLAIPLLAFFDGDLRSVFLFAFIPSAFSAALVLVVKQPPRKIRPGPPRLNLLPGARLKPFLIVTALFALGNSSDAFLLLRAKQLGLDATTVVTLFAVFNATYVLSAFPAGVAADRLGYRTLYAAGLLVFAAVYTAFALATPALLWFLFPVYGLYMGLTDGVSRALVVSLAEEPERATALGWHAAVTGACTLPASLLAGLLWEWQGAPAPFLYGAVMAAIAVCVLLLAKPVG